VTFRRRRAYTHAHTHSFAHSRTHPHRRTLARARAHRDATTCGSPGRPDVPRRRIAAIFFAVVRPFRRRCGDDDDGAVACASSTRRRDINELACARAHRNFRENRTARARVCMSNARHVKRARRIGAEESRVKPAGLPKLGVPARIVGPCEAARRDSSRENSAGNQTGVYGPREACGETFRVQTTACTHGDGGAATRRDAARRRRRRDAATRVGAGEESSLSLSHPSLRLASPAPSKALRAIFGDRRKRPRNSRFLEASFIGRRNVARIFLLFHS